MVFPEIIVTTTIILTHKQNKKDKNNQTYTSIPYLQGVSELSNVFCLK